MAPTTETTATTITQAPDPTHILPERAIIPTKSGQIGINPVEEDIGDPSTYIGQVAPTDSPYLVLHGQETQVCDPSPVFARSIKRRG